MNKKPPYSPPYDTPYSAPRWWDNPKPIVLICNDCKHYIKETIKCKAFPDRIPDEVQDTPESCPGNNGIKFEPIENK